jgi:hypothetical protein
MTERIDIAKARQLHLDWQHTDDDADFLRIANEAMPMIPAMLDELEGLRMENDRLWRLANPFRRGVMKEGRT